MSRNPILTQKAFDGVASDQSPAEEWQNAQTMGTASTATSAGIDAAMANQPMTPAAAGGKVMTLGGVAAATAIMFAVLLATAAWGWSLISVTKTVDPVTGAPSYVTQGSPWGYVIVAAIVALVAADALQRPGGHRARRLRLEQRLGRGRERRTNQQRAVFPRVLHRNTTSRTARGNRAPN
jgi:hypothetical protein